MKTIIYILSATLLIGVSFSACKKKSSTSSKLEIRMMKQSSDFQEVNIEVLGIDIHTTKQGWISLPMRDGVYNVQTLRSNSSQILVKGAQIPSGTMTQMRVHLGTNNYVVINDTIHPLAKSSPIQNVFKTTMKYFIEPNETCELMFEFDTEKSIISTRKNEYTLKPIIKILSIITL